MPWSDAVHENQDLHAEVTGWRVLFEESEGAWMARDERKLGGTDLWGSREVSFRKTTGLRATLLWLSGRIRDEVVIMSQVGKNDSIPAYN